MSEIISIDTIFLHVTKACDLRCAYCYFSAREPLPDEMSAEEFRSIWPGVVRVKPQKLIFTGGEPLLRPDILELIKDLRNADPEHRVIRCLNTNGRNVTASIAGELKGLIDEVRVSIDALIERNDHLRGAGSFDTAMRAIDIFRAAGIEVKGLVTVTRYSLPDLEKLLCFLIARGLTAINLNKFRRVGKGVKCADQYVSEDDIASVMERIRKRLSPMSRSGETEATPSQTTCGVGRYINIMPDGNVFPCHVLTQPEFKCGNLREENLPSICGRDRLLGKLSRLNFKKLDSDRGLPELTTKGACMGEVYIQHPNTLFRGQFEGSK
jgi:MoaA/NifB/PqqE/SkfB family radical SAM enzyme